MDFGFGWLGLLAWDIYTWNIRTIVCGLLPGRLFWVTQIFGLGLMSKEEDVNPISSVRTAGCRCQIGNTSTALVDQATPVITLSSDLTNRGTWLSSWVSGRQATVWSQRRKVCSWSLAVGCCFELCSLRSLNISANRPDLKEGCLVLHIPPV